MKALAAAVLLVASLAAAPARADAAHDIVGLPALKAMRADMETALADVLARPVFLGLRSDAAWGPENVLWQSRFGAFRDAYLDLAAGSLAGVDAELEKSLRLYMTTADLASLHALLRGGTYSSAMTQLALLGVDSFTMVRIAGAGRSPDLYSEAEKAAVHTRFAGLAERRNIHGVDNAATEAAVKVAQRPEVHQLQSVLSAVVSQALRRAVEDSPRGQAFLAQWRNEVKED